MNRFQKFSVAASTALLALGVSVGSASAASLNWTLNGVTFDDGGTATGSFTYDADTNTYGSFSVSTQGGSVLTPFTYDTSTSQVRSDLFNAPSVLFVNNTFSQYILLAFTSSLTNAGGTVALGAGNVSFDNGGFTGTSYECNNCSLGRIVTQGSVTTRPVPVPGAVFGVVVAGGALIARQRKNAKAKQTVA